MRPSLCESGCQVPRSSFQVQEAYWMMWMVFTPSAKMIWRDVCFRGCRILFWRDLSSGGRWTVFDNFRVVDTHRCMRHVFAPTTRANWRGSWSLSILGRWCVRWLGPARLLSHPFKLLRAPNTRRGVWIELAPRARVNSCDSWRGSIRHHWHPRWLWVAQRRMHPLRVVQVSPAWLFGLRSGICGLSVDIVVEDWSSRGRHRQKAKNCCDLGGMHVPYGCWVWRLLDIIFRLFGSAIVFEYMTRLPRGQRGLLYTTNILKKTKV